jgi:serralysin
VATDKTYVALHSESGDLNGDGVADLVVTWAASDFSVGRVQVLFGDKAGGFKDATSLSFPVASFADWVREATLADINNDGALDILVGRGTNTPIFLNDGYGRFVNLPDTLPLSQYFVAQAKDINGDGRTDLVYDVQLMYDPVFGNQERLTVLTGRDGGLVQTGDAGANGLLGDGDSEIFLGLGGDDVIFAAGGNDTLTGGAGNDYLHGGTGVDTAVYSGARSAYGLHFSTATGWSITDRRGGSPDGTDRLVSIETLQFSDGVYALSTLALGLDTAVANMLRLSNGVNLTRVSAEIDISLAGDVASARVAAVADLVKAADATTSVATLSYQFFTGKIPTAAGYDYLVSPTGPNPNNINAAYYQDFNLENRYINFAVNLGKLGEGKDAFAASYGSMSLFDATKAIYGRIFGATPTDAKVHALLDPTFNFNGQTITRADYFAIYGQDGVNGIGTKAAMVGWLMAEAEKADLGLYAKANAAFLTDLSDGATLNVDLIGVYGRPEYAFGG